MDLISLGLFVICIICGVVEKSDAFNIDVKSAKVFRGQPGTGFGHSAEFVRQKGNGKVSLFVGAPNETVTERNNSGIYHDCDPVTGGQCARNNAPPQPGVTTRTGEFGEQHELFGMALTAADETTAVVCGPMWSDLQWWYRNYDFNVGRCQVLPATDEGVTPYRQFKKYISDIEMEGRVSRQMLYGRAEFGFSADSDGKGRVVVGSPGYSVSRGAVVVLDIRFNNYTLMELILDSDPDIVLGYAVAVGNFCGSKRFCFAASNRQVFGKVHLLEHVQRSAFKALVSIKGEQEYSSFGSALCAVDVTGDGWADLLVGAPTFTHFGNDSRSYDQGRVFVYTSKGEVLSGQENFNKGTTLSGDERMFSRFGSAISSIGDINRDSINDIAVGAPLEEEGSGAVYIYLGSRNGPANRYSQKIRGKDFTPPLSSFGAHISKPTSELSDYNYPDFAIGAPGSAAAVFLKTRLIVNAHVSIETTPNPVDKINGLCPRRWGRTESGCVNVSLCLNFTYSTTGLTNSSASKFRSLYFNVVLEVDQLISSDGARRVRVYNPEDGSTITSLQLTPTVTSTRHLCLPYLAILKQDQIDRNPFVPVELTASFSLNTTSFPGIAPMLNQSMPNSVTHQLRFKNQCGQDQKCQTDLLLSGHVEYVQPSHTIYSFNVINHTKQVDLVLEVVNSRETSFGLNLTVRLSGQIDFWTITGNSSLLCDDLRDSLLQCRGWTPLPQGKAVQIRLRFLANSVPLEPRNRLVTFDVTVMPSDPVENPEMDETNNVKRLKTRTAIVADVRLDGSSTPTVEYVPDSSQADVPLLHKLLVTNRGPSFLPRTVLNVTLPIRDSTGSDILVSANVTIKQGGVIKECPLLLITGSVVGDTTTTSTTTTTTSPSTTTAGSEGGSSSKTTSSPSGGGSTTAGDPFGGSEIEPSRRRRRRASGDDQKSPAPDSTDGRALRMDCGRYQCRIYQCPLMTLQAKKTAEVNVMATLRRAAIAFPGNVDSLYFLTTSSIAEPQIALFDPWSEPRRLEVATQIRRDSGGDEINIWYIIIGIIAGLLLLLVIGLLAWKCGFFKRKDKAKLERLKRQSGFYDSNRSMKRKSQRASSSGSGPEKE